MTMIERFGRKDVERAVPVQARDRRRVGCGPGTIRTATSGTLTFLAGESTERTEVSVLDDAHDKGEKNAAAVETLVGAVDGRRDDGNDRESRSAAARAAGAVRAEAAVHVIEHVEVRWQPPRVPGFGGRVRGVGAAIDADQTA